MNSILYFSFILGVPDTSQIPEKSLISDFVIKDVMVVVVVGGFDVV